MTLRLKFDKDADNVVSGGFSTGTGPVLRSQNMEVTKISFAKGKGTGTHQHAEEQVMYVLQGECRGHVQRRTFYACSPARRPSTSTPPHSVMAIDRGGTELQEPGGADLLTTRLGG